MEELAPGTVDTRTGKVVSDRHGDWTSHPNNPAAQAAE
jgi:dihydropyrimidine dehydrogenase (NAD+) subunit PreA